MKTTVRRTSSLLRDLARHLERAEMTLGDVRVSGAELVKANAAFSDVVACQQLLGEIEERAVRYGV